MKLTLLLNLIIKTPKKSSGQICPPPNTIKLDLPQNTIRVKIKINAIILQLYYYAAYLCLTTFLEKIQIHIFTVLYGNGLYNIY